MADAPWTDVDSRADFVEIAPNSSMTPRAALVFFAWVAAFSLGIAAVFAAFGFWPVLPFAGLEMLVLGIALRISVRRGEYREVIGIDARYVVLRRRDNGRLQELTLTRGWTRVRLRPARVASYPSRLEIGSHGKWHEIGACLTESERIGLKRRLVELLDPGSAANPA